MSLKEIIKALSQSDLDTLRYALEQEDTQFIKLEGNTFVGVNIPPNFKIIEECGNWSYGTL